MTPRAPIARLIASSIGAPLRPGPAGVWLSTWLAVLLFAGASWAVVYWGARLAVWVLT